MLLKHEELLEELNFKDNENFEMMKKIQEMENKLEEMEEKLQGKGQGIFILYFV